MGGLDRLTDGLMYKDLAGRRRLRRYVLAAIAIFILVGGITFLGWRQRQAPLAMRTVTSTAAIASGGPLQKSPAPTTAAVIPAGAQPASSTAPASEPSATAVPPTQPATQGVCPTDPNAWELLEIAQGDKFKRIAPPCVYEGLGRTVAWDLLRVMGYSATEAAELLGFADFPWRPAAEITGMTNTQGPMTIELEYTSDEVKKQVAHPNFRTWIVDQGRTPGMAFALRGCYRTESVQENQLESWGVAYPVVCIVSVDQLDWALLELGSHRYTFKLSPVRQFSMYGYAGNGLWIEIGYQKEPVVEILLPGSIGSAMLPLTMGLEQIIQDRIVTSGLHGLVPWDAAWLEATYGLSMRALPENWQSLNDLNELHAIEGEASSIFERREAP